MSFLNYQKRLESINIQQKKEYVIFIIWAIYKKWNAKIFEKFLKYLLNSFKKNDLDCIDLISNFSFSRYNKIYFYDNTFNNDESEIILPLVE